jgi:hypothetical protein
MEKKKKNDFTCEKCGTVIHEDENGTRTNYCEHYPPEDGRMIQSTFNPKKRNEGEKLDSENTSKK